MMFIICDKDPVQAVNYLIENTDKKILYDTIKGTMSTYLFSREFRKYIRRRPQAKEIQAWIKEYPIWTFMFLKSIIIMV